MGRLKHKRGRKSNYVKSLNNPYHQEVRERALLRDKFQCQDCHSCLFLELHHIQYYVDGVNILGKELDYMDYVVILCEDCHKKRHKRE